MMRSLFTGVTGLKQHQTRMDVLSNNIANVNTTGFKRGRALFQDLFCETLRNAQQAFGNYGGLNPMQVGLGVKLASIDTLMEQGAIETTDKNTDLAIEGNGFFVVKATNGNNYYTRDGNFNINPNYDLVSANTGFQIQGWLSTQNPVTGNLELNDTGTIPTSINIVKYLKKHAHQTNNVTYASNLDSSSDERDIKLGVDYLAFTDTAGNGQKLQFKFQKIDAQHWVWSAIDDTQGNVANGAFTTDADGNLIETTVEPAAPDSTPANPGFIYDPDGTWIPANATTPLAASANTGNGSSTSVTASGNLVKDENISIVFDGGDEDRATTFRVVGEKRGYIGGGTLGGTTASLQGNAVKINLENGWTPSQEVEFQITDVQNLNNTSSLQTREKRATITFNQGTEYSIADIKNVMNRALEDAGISAIAQYDSTTKKFAIVGTAVGSNHTLMMDNISGPLAQIGFDSATQTGTEFLSNYNVSYNPEPFAIATTVIFQVSDDTNHIATVRFDPGSYTRAEIQTKIQAQLNQNGVTAQASFIDSDNDADTIPDRLRIAANAGSTIQINDVQNFQSIMGMNPITIGANSFSSALDLSGFISGTASSGIDYGSNSIAINNDVIFRIEDQYLYDSTTATSGDNDDPATNQITIPARAAPYTRDELKTLIQNRLNALELPAQVSFVDTNADGTQDQLQLNGLVGEKIRITDVNGRLASTLGITPSNRWQSEEAITFRVARPYYDRYCEITIPANTSYNSEQLQTAIQTQLNTRANWRNSDGTALAAAAPFTATDMQATLIDENQDGVLERLQIKATNNGERIWMENIQNISFIGFKSGVNNTGTGGAAPQVYSNTGMINTFTRDAWNPTQSVNFLVSDSSGHQAEIQLPDMDASNNQITYTRSDILSTINTELIKNNVNASATFVDTNNDNIDDSLVFTGKESGSGQKIILSGDASIEQLGLRTGTYSGTAATATFNQGGLSFALNEGNIAWKPNEALNFKTMAEQGASESVKISLPKPNSDGSFVFQTTVDGETFKTTGAINKGAIHTTSITVYDSLGQGHELTTSWEHTDKAKQEWVYKLSLGKNDTEIQTWLKNPANGVVDPANPTDAEISKANDAIIKNRTGLIKFSNNGKIDLAASTIKEMEMTPKGSNPVTIKLDQGLVTQFDSAFTTAARDQDGYEMGLLESIYFEADGTIRGVYSNGQKQPIGMVALASFNNPGGLEKKGKNLYEFSPNSGYPVIGKPQQGDRGAIVPGALEMSNVDLSEEFTNMIVTQRAFQANSRVITTSDEILQEVVNLKR